MHAFSSKSSPAGAQIPFALPLAHSTIHPSTSVLLLKWENDGRTMGELRTKERKKSGRIYIGHRDGNQNKTVIISLSISRVSALLLNSIRLV